MILYMAVTNDEYELPMYIELTMKDLADKVGLHKSIVSRHISGDVKNCRYLPYKIIKVEVEDD